MSEKKKILKKVTLGVLTIASVASIFFGSRILQRSSQVNSCLLPEELYEKRIESLNMDEDFIKDNRLELSNIFSYNKNEPIYVCVDDNLKENSKMYECVQEGVEYIFSEIGEMNPNYYYKFVDKNEFLMQKALQKSVIYFKSKDLEKRVNYDPAGCELTERNISDCLKFKQEVRSNSEITIDTNKLADSKKEQILNIVIHELCHTFGRKDLYNVGYNDLEQKEILEYIKTPFRSVMSDKSMTVFSPVDYDCFLSNYASKQFSKNDIKTLSDNYRKKYYDHLDSKLYEELESGEPIQVLSSDDIKSIEELNWNSGYYAEEGLKVIAEKKLTLKLNEDAYEIFSETLDGEKRLIKGKVMKTDHFYILQDVYADGKNPISVDIPGDKEFNCNDYVLFKKDDHIVIRDSLVNNYSIALEKNIKYKNSLKNKEADLLK